MAPTEPCQTLVVNLFLHKFTLFVYNPDFTSYLAPHSGAFSIMKTLSQLLDDRDDAREAYKEANETSTNERRLRDLSEEWNAANAALDREWASMKQAITDLRRAMP